MAHRRREVSRVEGFSDAVFAFAITLLVVSLEVPKSFDELMHVMRGFPAFAASFAILFQVWWRHFRFFRTYDLEDSFVIVVTGMLLFVVLFYVYPMKFVWSLFQQSLEGRAITDEMITSQQVSRLFVFYGVGGMAVYGLLAALYGHAYRLRRALELGAADTLDARVEMYRNLGMVFWAALSVTLAILLPPALAGKAGLVYFGIGLSETLLGTYRGKMHAKIEAAASKSAENTEVTEVTEQSI